MTEPDNAQRIDKWLWFARFFKTRGLAADAVKAGHVEINGARAKPGKSVRAGDRLRIRKAPYEYEVEVIDPGTRRGSAVEARQLFSERADSIAKRERLAEQLRIDRRQGVHPGRPSKRDRRELERARRRLFDGGGAD